MPRKRQRGAHNEQATPSIPCGGKGWRGGECEFCRRKGAEYCLLINVPREMPARVGSADVLRGMRWGGRCGGRRKET